MRKVLYILGELEDTDLEWLAQSGTLRPVPRGTEIVREGASLDSVFIVLDGELAATVHGTEIARLGSGEIVGEMSLLSPNLPGAATLIATEDTSLFAVPQPRLRSKLSHDARFAARFYRALCVFLAHRLKRTDALVAGQVPVAAAVGSARADELPEPVLKNTALAGKRFHWFLNHVRSS